MAQKKKIVAIIFTSLVDYQKLAKQDSKLALEILGMGPCHHMLEGKKPFNCRQIKKTVNRKGTVT